MKLIKNWPSVLFGSWSVRLAILAAIFSALPMFFAMVNADMLGINPVYFAAIATAVSVLGALARIVQQAALSGAMSRFIASEDGWVRRRTVAPLAALSIAAAVAFTAPWEGERTTAYIDMVGTPTVCFGETKGVKIGDKYTPAQCKAMLAGRIAEFRDRLGKCLTVEVPEGVAIVVVDWSYNVGIGAACSSTLVRKANAGDLFGACDELLRWDKGRVNGKLQRIKGLTNRRVAERNLCVKSLIAAGYSRTAR